MERNEIVEIFEYLTNTHRRTWILEGTLSASLQSFNAITNHTTESSETVKYDGNRFYWEINTVLDDESPNQKRIFIWDGQWYSMYFKSAKRAVSTNNLMHTSPTITGCLTKGVVPWGYGIYSYEKLMNSDFNATEKENSGQKLIYLNITNNTGVGLSIVLDPAKDYAVLSNSISSDNTCITYTYLNYVIKGNQWVPSSILIERYLDCETKNDLACYDYWTFDYISTEKPREASFNAAYDTDSLIEYQAESTNRSLFCKYSPLVNTKELLYKKLEDLNSTNSTNKNCATLALKYTAESLGLQITDSNLAVLVDTSKNETNLLAMKQFANNIGLQSLAVQTNIRALNNMTDYKAILYLPWNKHYVVLSHIENDNVWVIDLASNSFCYNLPIAKFNFDSIEENVVALLISNGAVNLQNVYTEIPSEELREIVGSAGLEKYSCTDLIQAYNIEFCQPSPIPLIPCWGMYTVWYNRYGCIEDENGGECNGTDLVGSLSSACIEDPQAPGNCIIDGYWRPHYIRACQ
ncbi:MAG: hypothetical protein JW806_06330 [Sedimentisphaerales bacterium]|nr:hypothetical protein [Sedimentisphaerales bacterium]